MSTFFSIAPPPSGRDLELPFVPDVEYIQQFAKGDFNISKELKLNFIYDMLQKSDEVYPETLEQILKTSGFELQEGTDLEKYINDNGRVRIPIDKLVDTGGFDYLGLPALEKMSFQTVFETQGPYMELIINVVEQLPKLEDIVSRVLALIQKSRKPEFNPKSLGFKLSENLEKINQIKSVASDLQNSSSLGDLTRQQRENGVDLLNNLVENSQNVNTYISGNFEWEIISIDYSTGVFIPGVNYKTVYRNIISNNNYGFNNTGDAESPFQEEGDNLPGVIVFGYYDENGDKINPSNDNVKYGPWLDRSYTAGSVGVQTTKWFGQWENIPNNQWSRYENYVKEYATEKLKQKGVTDPSEVNDALNFILDKMDVKSLVSQANQSSFMKLIAEGGEEGLNLGDDSPSDVNRVTAGRQFIFLPRKINHENQDIFIDPEADYYLQIVKLIPRATQDSLLLNELKRTNPIISNYQGQNVGNILDAEYLQSSNSTRTIPPNGPTSRVQDKANYMTDSQFENYGNKVRYVVEGIRRKKPKDSESNDDNKWYKKLDFFGAIKGFIEFLIDIIVDIIPQIKNLIDLFRDPYGLIFDKIFEKLESNFEFLSKDTMSRFSNIFSLPVEERRDYIENDEILKKYVSIDNEDRIRFIFDGFAGIGLFGQSLGINLFNFVPKLKVDTLFQGLKNNLPQTNIEGLIQDINKDIQTQDIKDSLSGGFQKIPLDLQGPIESRDLKRILSKADELFELSLKTQEGVDLAMDSATLYSQVLKKDKFNQQVKEKLERIKNEFSIKPQMILQFVLGIVKLPFELIKGIIEEILDFFENISNIKNLPDSVDFFTFQWFTDFFKPQKILELIGMKFNPGLYYDWIEGLRNGSLDLDQKFDMSEIFSIPLLVDLPEFTGEQLLEIAKGINPLDILKQFLKFLEKIINNIICFIWDLLNLDVILDKPEMDFSKFASSNLTPQQIQDVLNGDTPNGNNAPARFVFDVTLPNGQVIRNLNYSELEEFKKENDSYRYIRNPN